MKCEKCDGRVFLDRVFTDNLSFETSCLHCGNRKFIGKTTPLGAALVKLERTRDGLENGLYKG